MASEDSSVLISINEDDAWKWIKRVIGRSSVNKVGALWALKRAALR
jgi:hypothetical protein